MAYPEITAVENAIHNPEDPRHFMAVVPAEGRVRISWEVMQLVDTTRAIIVVEIGRRAYAPVYYIPRPDVDGRFRMRSEKTRCPIKGEATYFDLLDRHGDVLVEKACWSYEHPIPEAAEIKECFAFYPAPFSFKLTA